MRITKIIRSWNSIRESRNNENFRFPIENHENYEIARIPFENHENHENH